MLNCVYCFPSLSKSTISIIKLFALVSKFFFILSVSDWWPFAPRAPCAPCSSCSFVNSSMIESNTRTLAIKRSKIVFNISIPPNGVLQEHCLNRESRFAAFRNNCREKHRWIVKRKYYFTFILYGWWCDIDIACVAKVDFSIRPIKWTWDLWIFFVFRRAIPRHVKFAFISLFKSD